MIITPTGRRMAGSRGQPSVARRGVLRVAGMPLMLAVLCLPLLAGAGVALTAAVPQAVHQADADALLYDLAADERAGGHTLARHVGKSDEELAERLRREPRISAASTYSDVETARRVVGAAVARARARINAWASRSGPRPNLVLDYRSGRAPIGRALSRGARVSVVATRALVVLRWNDRRRRWYVLTSYPEARR